MRFFFCCSPKRDDELIAFASSAHSLTSARKSEFTEPKPAPFTLSYKQMSLVCSLALSICTLLSGLLIYEDWEDVSRCNMRNGSKSPDKCDDFDFRYHIAIVFTAILATMALAATIYPAALTCVQNCQDRRNANLRINATQKEIANYQSFDL